MVSFLLTFSFPVISVGEPETGAVKKNYRELEQEPEPLNLFIVGKTSINGFHDPGVGSQEAGPLIEEFGARAGKSNS